MADYNYYVLPQKVTILSGQTVSDAKDLANTTLCGIETPAALTSTAITFQGSNDGTTYVPIKDSVSGAAISVTVTTSSGYSLNPSQFAGWRFIKVVGGSAEGADRIIKLCVRQLQ